MIHPRHKYKDHRWVYQSSKIVDGRREQIDTCDCGAVRERSWKVQKRAPSCPSKRPLPNRLSKVPKWSKTLQKPPGRKRTPLAKVSDKRKEWNALYQSKHESDPPMVWGWGLVAGKPHGMQMYRSNLERHHPFRRLNWAILLYRYVTPEFHEWIEANGTRARRMGLIYDVERGELRNPSPHDPFEILQEFQSLKSEYQP